MIISSKLFRLSLIILGMILVIGTVNATELVDINYTQMKEIYPKPNWSVFHGFGSDDAPNLCLDASVEDGTNWFFGDGASKSSEIVHSGNYSAKLDSTGYVSTTYTAIATSPYFNVENDTLYEVSFWVYSYSKGDTRYATVLWYNATGAYLGRSVDIPLDNPRHEWVKIMFLVRSPTDAAKARIRVSQINSESGMIAYLDDFEFRKYTALMLRYGSYQVPLVILVDDLPKTVTLQAKVNIGGNWITTNVTNWSVKLEDQTLTVISASYNTTSGWWEIVTTIPTLDVDIYNLTVECDHTDTGYHFYTKGKVWIYEPKELEDLVIIHVSDMHFYDKLDPRRYENDTNLINAFYIADQIINIKPDIVIDTGDLGDSYQEPLEYLTWIDYLNAHGIPVFYVTGNHEGHPKGHWEFNQDYYWKWVKFMGDPDRYYSVDFGNYRLIAIWTDENNTGTTSTTAAMYNSQLVWFKSELEEATSQGRKIIVAMHVPAILPNVGLGTSWANITQRDLIINYVNNSNVLIVLQGHEHNTEPDSEFINGTLWVFTLSYGKVVNGLGTCADPGFRIVRIDDSGVYTWYVPTFYYTHMVDTKNLYENCTFSIDRFANKIVVVTELGEFSELPIQTVENAMWLGATLQYHPDQANVLLLKDIKIGSKEFVKVPAYVSANCDVNVTLNEYSSSRISFTADAPEGESVMFTIGGLYPDTLYKILVDGNLAKLRKSDTSGTIIFNWSDWSTHTFIITSSEAITYSSNVLLPLILGVGIALLILAVIAQATPMRIDDMIFKKIGALVFVLIIVLLGMSYFTLNW